MEMVAYGGWPRCVKLANDRLELIATAGVGPRIIRLATIGGANMFKEYADQLGAAGGDEWRIYGGHRLWSSPEHKVRTYDVDNSPVEVEERGDAVILTPPPDEQGQLQKQIELLLDPAEPQVTLTHRITNQGPWPIELAVWALSVMDQGSKAILPHPSWSDPDELLPNRTLTLWPYVDMQDPRVNWGSRFITLQQDPAREARFKLGLSAYDGWVAVANHGCLFVKRFDHQPGANYPDWGCSAELFTNGDMLEAETLSPLTRLDPEATVEHVERWHLLEGVDAPADEAAIERDILPRVEALG